MPTTILGGGISGLAAAYYLTKTGCKNIRLLEATSYLGGWIITKKFTDKGFLFETGPRTLRPFGPKGQTTLELIENLGLSELVVPITANHAAAKNRMIFVDNQLCMLPSSISGLFKTLPPFSKPLYSAILHDLKTGRSKQSFDDESIYDFAERRFGTEIAKYAISAMICGICAGDAREISVKFLMEDLFTREQKYGGVCKAIMIGMLPGGSSDKKINIPIKSELVKRSIKEKWRIYSLDGGLNTLPATLETYLTNHDNILIKLNSKCNEIVFNENTVHVHNNDTTEFSDFIVSSLPAYQLGEIVQKQHAELSNELNSIPYVDVAVINLQFDDPNLLKQSAFGFLVPPSENRSILGVIYDSCCFDMKQNTVLTVMMGGRWFLERFGAEPTNEQLLDIAMREIRDILKINTKPNECKVNVLRNCIPQYVLGHTKRVANIREYIAEHRLPLALCGAAYDGVGVNDVIYSAKDAVKSIK